ncbi:MAG: DNA cytosine methyltransferase [Proteobacteria bacterium]|nr:DNA cytosine methyltransferase [Pseudomonadota bacterium]
MNVVELFAGAGGLGMGVSLAGFSPKAVIEWNRWACDTVRENARRGYPLVGDWPLTEGDVREFDFTDLGDEIDLVVGGPPCQPFPLGGKHRADEDARDMFPATVRAIRQTRPRAFIVENVRGLTRPAFANYFQYVVLQLTFPELVRRAGEEVLDHLARLEQAKTSGQRRGLTYKVVHRVLNAANYGVPQKRERVFIVGFRADLGVEWNFPDETHSLDALLEDQWVTGDYWDRHEIATGDQPAAPSRLAGKIDALRQSNLRPSAQHKPWKTVRDGLVGLPDPRDTALSGAIHNHRFQQGARAYPGHTGSPLDLPSKALKAGVHGVPGGENMMVMDDGNVRYFTAREAARMQTFPDGYVFHGAWSEIMRQLGNAVPVKLAHVVASSVAVRLVELAERKLKSFLRA